jgi:hypothetical protein
MTKTNSELQTAFGAALANARQATSDLVSYLNKQGKAAWVWPNPEEQQDKLFSATNNHLDLQQSLALAGEIINAFWYVDGQDAREVRICPGLIAVGLEGIKLAHNMNHASQELAKSLAAMEGRVEPSSTDPKTGALIERPLREVAQEAFGAARLHYQQATRAIVILNHAPTYAGFTWANCRKVFRTTAGEVRRTITERLDPERPDPLLLLDLKSLQNLTDSHPLAVVRPASLTPKVNLAWTDNSGAVIRTIKRSVLPLLYVGNALPERLYELPPSPTLPRTRSKRNDVELEDRPFLATVAAHRYLRGET